MGYFEFNVGFKLTVLGSYHFAEQLSFSMIPSIPTFEFDLILGLFLSYGVLMGLFGSRSRV